jgi:hypothetical protein
LIQVSAIRVSLRPILCGLLAAALLIAADPPSWRARLIRDWNADDARLLLADSPWVKHSQPHWLPDLSPFQREDGGNLNEGVGKGVGIAGLGILGRKREAEATKQAHTKIEPDPVIVRWESAMPVRFAEHLAGDRHAPELKTDDYAIVVYGIPAPKGGNQPSLLKDSAVLRRSQKKDLKQRQVEVIRHEDDERIADIVYLFPRKVEITKRDGGIEFAAQIGRLWISQYFYTGEMQLRGEPQLLLPTEGPR